MVALKYFRALFLKKNQTRNSQRIKHKSQLWNISPELNTMATLQMKTIAAQRKTMLEGGMKAVFKNLFSFKEIPDILMSDHSYYNMAAKDILAFTLAHSAICDGAQIFGGFLCSIYSGVIYNDIDILFEETRQANSFCDKICNLIENILGLDFYEYTIREIPKSYSRSFRITATVEGVKAALEVDVTSVKNLPLSKSGIFHPVTWGRTLQYGKEGLSFRKVRSEKKTSKKPSLKYVEFFLSEQKDIKNDSFVLNIGNDLEGKMYKQYIDKKMENLKKEGYSIVEC